MDRKKLREQVARLISDIENGSGSEIPSWDDLEEELRESFLEDADRILALPLLAAALEAQAKLEALEAKWNTLASEHNALLDRAAILLEIAEHYVAESEARGNDEHLVRKILKGGLAGFRRVEQP